MIALDIITQAPKAVSENHKPEGWKFSITKEFPDTALELLDILGDENVRELALAQYKIQFQAGVRRLAEAGKSDEEIDATMRDWKPGDKIMTGDADPLARVATRFKSMSREEQAAFIAQLQGQLGTGE